jgi:hypothetical protein
MSEENMFRETEFLNAEAPLPVLSPGLRSRVLAAALEAQDRRSQGRRVLASALGLFAMLAGVAWMGPFSSESFSPSLFSNGNFSNASFFAGDASTSASSSSRLGGQRNDGQMVDSHVRGKKSAGDSASSALSSFSRGQGLMSVMGDDWRPVEAQLQSRQEHFPRFQM